jgi:hypothetical protein
MPAKRQRPRRHLALLVPLALAALTSSAGPALAQPPACGDTVTQDTTPAAPGQVGIDNRGHDAVTIRNGTVSKFTGGGNRAQCVG